MKVHIVNYGMGNIFSVQKKIQSRDITLTISSKIRDISNADKIILCGVGHFKKAMDNLHELNLIDSLNNFALIQKIESYSKSFFFKQGFLIWTFKLFHFLLVRNNYCFLYQKSWFLFLLY